MIEHLFYRNNVRTALSCRPLRRSRPKSASGRRNAGAAQRRGAATRLTAVIAQLGSPPGRRLLLELLLRGIALAVMALLILGLLPVIAGAAS
jgi:hypothetical protein